MVKNTVNHRPPGVTEEEARKFRPAMMERGPGPAAYYLKGTTGHKFHCATMKQSPAYSFGSRTKGYHCYTDTSVSPGPVYYITPKMTRMGKDGTPAYTLHDRIKTQKDNCSPGPAAYHAETLKHLKEKTPPAYTFGSRTTMAVKSTCPAPNAYTLPALTGNPIPVAGKKTCPAYTMVGRSRTGGQQETPGPGAYKAVHTDVYTNRSPAYTLHSRAPPSSDLTGAPGPGSHYPEKVTVNKTSPPMFSFGIKHSEFLAPCRVRDFDL